MTKNEVQTAIRLPADLVKRVDDLVGKLKDAPEFALFEPSRSAVMRLALLRGVELLEAEPSKKHKAVTR